MFVLNTNYRIFSSSAGEIKDGNKTIVSKGAKKLRVHLNKLGYKDEYFVAVRALEDGPALFGSWIKVTDGPNQGFYLNKNSAIKRLSAATNKANEVAALLENKQQIQLNEILDLFINSHPQPVAENPQNRANQPASPQTTRTENAANKTLKKQPSNTSPQLDNKRANVQASPQTTRTDQIAHTAQVKAILQREKGQFTKYLGDDQERSILEALGFGLKDYDDKDAFRSELNTVLDNHDFSSKKLEEIPQEIISIATTIRLNRAKVPSEKQEHVKILIDRMKKLKDKVLKKAKNIRLKEIETLHKLPLARKSLYKEHFERVRLGVDNQIYQALDQNKNAILELMEDNVDDFQTNFEDVAQTMRRSFQLRVGLEVVSPLISWYKKYQSKFISEIQQGEADSSEHLGEGVCFAYSMRLLLGSLKNPKQPIHEMDPDKILPEDRFLQASYQMGSESQVYKNGIPVDILRKKKLKSRVTLESTPTEFSAALKEDISKNKSLRNGSILVLWEENHGIFLRVDPINKILVLSDPNIGTLQFKYPRTDKEAAELIGNCVSELVGAFYPDTQTIFAIQAKKASPRK